MFLTPDQILQTAKRSEEINRQRMRDCYAEVSTEFADALFDVCMAEWRTGPATTWMRLNSSAKDQNKRKSRSKKKKSKKKKVEDFDEG